MNQSMPERSLADRARETVEAARSKPLATALILTAMLAVLLIAYSMAMDSSSSDTPESTGNETTAAENGESESSSDSGFLADGYDELEGEETSSGGTNWWGDVPGLMIRLVIVLGLAYGSLRLLNYFTRSGRLGGAQGKALEVVDHLNLGQNRSIYLVRVSGRVLVVGATGNQLNLLSRMTLDDLPEDVRTQAPNFTSQLQTRLMRQIGITNDDTSEIEERRKSLQELRDEEPVPS